MKEPLSTLSNAGYLVSGIMRLSNPVIGISHIVLGLASAAFHGMGVKWARNVDEMAMYLVFWMHIWWELSMSLVFTGVIGGICTLVFAWFYQSLDSHKWVPGMFAGLTLIKAIQGDPMWYLIPFAIAGAFWMIGHLKGKHYDWAHGVWHVGTARGLYMI